MRKISAFWEKNQGYLAIASFAAVGLAWAALLIWGRHLSRETWARIFPGFNEAEKEFGISSPERIVLVVAICLAFLTAALAGGWLIYRFRSRLQNPRVTAKIFSVAAYLGAVFILFLSLFQYSSEAPWYKIETMMTHPASVPVFGQRVLFVIPAILLKSLSSHISYTMAFLAVQLGAMVVAVYLMGRWAACFIGEQHAYLGQILLAFLMAPTFHYWTFHDVGVVLIYTLCFLLLYRRQYWLFLATFGLGIVNHPNIFVLLPTAVVILWGKETRTTVVRMAVAMLVIYIGTRMALNAVLPLPFSEEWKVWYNMRLLADARKELIIGQLTLLPWYLCGAMAFRYADPILKRAAILLPLQYAIYLVFGQLNEARIFNNFLPVLIGIFMCYIRATLDAKTASG